MATDTNTTYAGWLDSDLESSFAEVVSMNFNGRIERAECIRYLQEMRGRGLMRHAVARYAHSIGCETCGGLIIDPTVQPPAPPAPPMPRAAVPFGRPRVLEPGRNVQINLSDDLVNWADCHARDQRVSRAEIVRRALSEYRERNGN